MISIQNTLTSYTDLTIIEGQLLYVVAAVKPGAFCDISNKKGVLPVDFMGASFSNMFSSFNIIEGVQIHDTDDILIYPNSVNNNLVLNISDILSGVYFVKMQVGNEVVLKKIVKE